MRWSYSYLTLILPIKGLERLPAGPSLTCTSPLALSGGSRLHRPPAPADLLRGSPQLMCLADASPHQQLTMRQARQAPAAHVRNLWQPAPQDFNYRVSGMEALAEL